MRQTSDVTRAVTDLTLPSPSRLVPRTPRPDDGRTRAAPSVPRVYAPNRRTPLRRDRWRGGCGTRRTPRIAPHWRLFLRHNFEVTSSFVWRRALCDFGCACAFHQIQRLFAHTILTFIFHKKSLHKSGTSCTKVYSARARSVPPCFVTGGPAVTMPAHLARGTEVRRLYRKGLELSRLFPDPCGRNYLMRRVQEVFRKRATETSPTKIGRHIKEGAQSVRRMERALHARADYERVTQLAYGVVGRVKHALASALAEINVSSSPNEKTEKTNQNRPPKWALPPLPGSARETFTLGLLMRKIEMLARAGSNGPDTGHDVLSAGHDSATAEKMQEHPGDKRAVQTQLAALRDSVPPHWRRRVKHMNTTRSGDTSSADTNEVISSMGIDTCADFVKKRWRQDWLPNVWDVDRSANDELGSDESKTRKPNHWVGFPDDGGDANAWETTHVALLLTTFRPVMRGAVIGTRGVGNESQTSDDESLTGNDARVETGVASKVSATNSPVKVKLKRSWRRFYGGALGMAVGEGLVVRHVPAEWSCFGKALDDDKEVTGSIQHQNRRVVLTHGARVVDEFEAR